MKNNWKQVFDPRDEYLKVYVHKITGNIRVIYPKARKWAQKAAYKIYRNMKLGEPTEKGVPNIVKGLWAKIIYEAFKSKK
jgi:hypothetical protein